jgi:hypothetical protein
MNAAQRRIARRRAARYVEKQARIQGVLPITARWEHFKHFSPAFKQELEGWTLRPLQDCWARP